MDNKLYFWGLLEKKYVSRIITDFGLTNVSGVERFMLDSGYFIETLNIRKYSSRKVRIESYWVWNRINGEKRLTKNKIES